MAKLVLMSEQTVLGHYFLAKNRFTIGRQPDSDLVLDVVGVSKQHAAVFTLGNDQILEDLQSTNGTYVNGERVAKHILQNDDVIVISDYALRYINAKAMPDMDFDKTMFMQGLNGTGRIQGDVTSGMEAPAARGVVQLAPAAMIEPIDAHRSEKIVLNKVLTPIGLDGERVVLHRRRNAFYAVHVTGRKTITVNGQAFKSEPYQLRNGDIIEVAGLRFRFLTAG